MMQFNEWTVLLILLKLASYLSISTLAGTLLMRFIITRCNDEAQQLFSFYEYLKNWQIKCLIIGVIAVMLRVPIESGAMVDLGIMGMLDPFMLEMVWTSVIGDQVAIRIPALISGLIAAFMWNVKTDSYLINYCCNGITVFALGLLAYSFTLTGHSAGEDELIKIILIFHLIAIASWIGSLLPLYKSCSLLPIDAVKRLMHYFGQMAVVIVLVLFITGITLLLQYLTSFDELLTSSYGQLILLKLLLVSCILLLGMRHKLILVPKMTQQHHVNTLKRSISVEIFIVFLILITTSIFTTFTGPTL